MERIVLEMQHRLNPLHVYCRLIDRGISRNLSMRLCRCYEEFLYKKFISPICR